MHIGELLGLPHLRMSLLAGPSGLERHVTWAHSSDLAAPWDWIAGGELLMKNGRTMPRSADGQVAFLRNLAAAAAAGLLIGSDPRTPALTRRARDEAGSLGLPVLEIPYSVSFLAVSRAVADASMEDEARRMARAERIYAVIRDALRTSSPASFVRKLETELGHRLYVFDAVGLFPALRGTRVADDRLAEQIRASLRARDRRLPAVVRLPDLGRRSAVMVEAPFEDPTVLVGQRSDRRTFDASLLHHAATAVAVVLAHQALRDDAAVQEGASLLGQLLDATIGAAAAETGLLRHGLSLTSCRLVAGRGELVTAPRRVANALHHAGVAHTLVQRGDVSWALLGGAGAASVGVGVLLDHLPAGAAVGISAPVETAVRVPEAAREALFASGVAPQRGGVATYGEVGHLPVVRDEAEARAVVGGILGPVLEYDRRHGAELLHTLRTFLACERSWIRTAAELHVHRQTVVYRISRVEKLTGKDVSVTADLAGLWLAVSAHELLADMQRLGPAGGSTTGRLQVPGHEADP